MRRRGLLFEHDGSSELKPRENRGRRLERDVKKRNCQDPAIVAIAAIAGFSTKIAIVSSLVSILIMTEQPWQGWEVEEQHP